MLSQGPINNNQVLVQIMAWRRPGDKPLTEPIMARLLTHMCVTRPEWVNHSKDILYHIHWLYDNYNIQIFKTQFVSSLLRPWYQFWTIFQLSYCYMSIQCFIRPLFSFFRDDWHMKGIRFCSKHIECYSPQPNRSENTYLHFVNINRIEAIR